MNPIDLKIANVLGIRDSLTVMCTIKREFLNKYSPFCVQAKIIKLVGLKNGGRLSPINLVTFAGTQNGE